VRLRPWGDTSEASTGIVEPLNIGAGTFVQSKPGRQGDSLGARETAGR
jgi:hypothetical protein